MNTRPQSPTHADRRRAMVSFATLLVILFLAVMLGLVFNAGQVITRKIETQNAADAVAYSSSVWVARGMNTITASNHLIGELSALYVLHHALGGKWLDEHNLVENATGEMKYLRDDLKNRFDGSGKVRQPGDPPSPSLNRFQKLALRGAIRAVRNAFGKVFGVQRARPIPANAVFHQAVLPHARSDVQSTVYQAKRELKQVVVAAYDVHLMGWFFYEIGEKITPIPLIGFLGPPMMGAGVAMEVAALATEAKAAQEYVVLDGVEIAATASKDAAQLISGTYAYEGAGVIEGLRGFQSQVVTLLAAPLEATAARVAEEHGATGFALGAVPEDLSLGGLANLVPRLPIEEHRRNAVGHSQFLRATYPWVRRWRDPPRRFFFAAATMSNACKHYADFTNLYSAEMTRCFRLAAGQPYAGWDRGRSESYGIHPVGKGVRLLVLEGLNPIDGGQGFQKSNERWNQPGSSWTAEQMFTHLGVARRPAPAIAAESIFRQENPDGLVCFAQSMVYNANPQSAPSPSGSNGDEQPRVGWDTLNWVANATEFESADPGPEFPWRMFRSLPPIRTPEIRLNWQARLTPTTQAKLAPVVVGAALLERVPIDGVAGVAGPLGRIREGLLLNNH